MDQTWLAYAFEHDLPLDRVERALARVGSHYAATLAYPLARRGSAGASRGLVTWSAEDPACRWPMWSQDGEIGVGTAYVPTGWTRVIGDVPPQAAAIPLARALRRDPGRIGDLDPPFVLGALDSAAGELVIFNDSLGAAQLYEMRVDDGWVWSNRLGALPLFAAIRPQADPRGWALLAASGWFMDDSTAIEGARKVRAGSVIRVDGSGVTRASTDSIGEIVSPRSERDHAGQIQRTAEQARELARTVDRLWAHPPEVKLSGGRDSRLSAAAVVAAGVDATFVTTDDIPGEADITRRLAQTAPRRISHEILPPRRESVVEDLSARTATLHLLDDGMRAPQGLRYAPEVPQPPALFAGMAGYGGEIAHGFFYSRQADLDRITRRGHAGPAERIEKFCRRKHEAARKEAYGLLRSEIDESMARGRSYGLEGPPLLDYFYLADRFVNKSRLNSRSNIFSVFATPAFLRTAFDVSPEQRFENVIHREVIARLVPEWGDVPFFSRDPTDRRMPAIKRSRIWETDDAAPIAEMIAGGGTWTEIFDPDRVRAMWAAVGSSEGHAHDEQVFERLVWRSSFDRHLELLGRAATAAPPATPDILASQTSEGVES